MNNTAFDGNARLKNRAAEIDAALSSLPFLQENGETKRLFEAMRYSLLAGGKRIRPVLLLEFCELFGGCAQDATVFACALEMIHTYSLIHDDLPCMDNDDLRRGRPTSHVVFGQAGAVLAGDALLNGAYELMISAAISSAHPARMLSAAETVAKAAGAYGMVGGQTLDIENETAAPDEARLRRTDALKTGALFHASCVAGAIIAGADDAGIAAAAEYAEKIGLAFQIVDDVLDVISSEAELGKPIGSDTASGKRTYVDFFGIDRCRELARELSQQAAGAVAAIPGSEFLVWLAQSLAERAR